MSALRLSVGGAAPAAHRSLVSYLSVYGWLFVLSFVFLNMRFLSSLPPNHPSDDTLVFSLYALLMLPVLLTLATFLSALISAQQRRRRAGATARPTLTGRGEQQRSNEPDVSLLSVLLSDPWLLSVLTAAGAAYLLLLSIGYAVAVPAVCLLCLPAVVAAVMLSALLSPTLLPLVLLGFVLSHPVLPFLPPVLQDRLVPAVGLSVASSSLLQQWPCALLLFLALFALCRHSERTAPAALAFASSLFSHLLHAASAASVQQYAACLLAAVVVQQIARQSQPHRLPPSSLLGADDDADISDELWSLRCLTLSLAAFVGLYCSRLLCRLLLSWAAGEAAADVGCWLLLTATAAGMMASTARSRQQQRDVQRTQCCV